MTKGTPREIGTRRSDPHFVWVPPRTAERVSNSEIGPFVQNNGVTDTQTVQVEDDDVQ